MPQPLSRLALVLSGKYINVQAVNVRFYSWHVNCHPIHICVEYVTPVVVQKVWGAFDKFIKPSGVSPSKMLEAIMRVAVDPRVARIWERIYYAIMKVVGDMEKSGALKQRHKKRD